MKKKEGASARTRRLINNTIVHIVLAILAVVWLFPIFWVVMKSFSTDIGPYTTRFWPRELTMENYRRLFTDTTVLNFPRMFLNTLIIACFCCVISTFLLLCVSYCMSRLRFKLRSSYMNLAMILTLFPSFMSMVAVYYILKALGLSEGAMIRVALIMVYSGGAGLHFYVAKGFFDTIPKALDEAAFLDGATRWQVFTKVTMPLSKPIIVYTILTSFMAPWTDFIFAKVICRANADYYTVSIGLWKMLEKEYITKWFTSFAAGAVLISIPIAVIFVATQKFYANGMSGAVKG